MESNKTKNKVIISSVILIWILICNIIIHINSIWLSELGFTNWAFFLINILFFLLEEKNIKKKSIFILAGSAVGIVVAGLFCKFFVLFHDMGAAEFLCFLVPIGLSLGIIIVLHPIWPVFFNGCGFAYFMVALIDPLSAWSCIPEYLFSMAAGHIVLNIGALIIIRLGGKYIIN